jgi:predicted nucleic acid-binding protein
LVYAHRRDSLFYESASRCVIGLAEGPHAWAIPWPCLHEFLGIVTRPRLYDPPSSVPQAVGQVDAWLASPSIVLLTEAELHWSHLKPLILAGRISGPRVRDARIAALCLQHGVRELWTADRDFSRFPQLKTLNPLLR